MESPRSRTVVTYTPRKNRRCDSGIVRLADGPRATRPAPHEWVRRNAAPRSAKGAR